MKLKDTYPLEEKLWQTNKKHTKKQRHYFVNKDPSSQSNGFSSSHVWMWGWTINQAEHQRIDAFELWYWRRLLRVPCTTRRSNQSILKEISPEYSLEGLMLKLKLQYFGHLMRRADTLEKTMMLGNIEDRRRRGMTEDEIVGWHHQLHGLWHHQTSWVWASSRSWWWTGRPGMLQSMGSQRFGHKWVTELNCLLEMGSWLRRALRQISWVPLEDRCERVPKVRRTG